MPKEWLKLELSNFYTSRLYQVLQKNKCMYKSNKNKVKQKYNYYKKLQCNILLEVTATDRQTDRQRHTER